MSTIDTTKLETLADNLEIQALKVRFFDAIDKSHADPEMAVAALGEMLVEDIKADYGPSGIFEGREAVIKFLIVAYSQFDWLWHSAHSPRIEISGGTAVGWWTSEGHARMKSSGIKVASINRYRNDFVKVAGRWRFTYIRDMIEATDSGNGWVVAAAQP